MKLILQIALFDKQISLQVRQQEDINQHSNFPAAGENRYTLASASNPQFDDNKLYLRGSNGSKDLDVLRKTFRATSSRDNHLNKIKQACVNFARLHDATFSHKDLGHTWILTINK